MTEQWKTRTYKEAVGNDYTERHPSYGVVGISRISGSHHLFASEVRHMHFISLRIGEARRVVNGAHEFLMSDKELIEIYMTEAQFAQMITQPNHGDGVACTINRCAGDEGEPWLVCGHRPDPPLPEHFAKKYKDVAGQRSQVISDSLATAKAAVSDLVAGVSKPSKANLIELQKQIESAIRQVESNLPYVMEELHEGIEKKMATAVNEFESYVAFSLQAKGLEHLSSQAPRLNGDEQKKLPDATEESPVA